MHLREIGDGVEARGAGTRTAGDHFPSIGKMV